MVLDRDQMVFGAVFSEFPVYSFTVHQPFFGTGAHRPRVPRPPAQEKL